MARVLRLAAAATCAASAAVLFPRLRTPVPTVRAFVTNQPSHQVAGPVWNLGRLNHVAIAVPDLEKAKEFYKSVLGAQVSEPVRLPEHGVSVVFVNLGNTKVELLHPLGNNSPIAGFLQKNKAGGMHHICIEKTANDNIVFRNLVSAATVKAIEVGLNRCPFWLQHFLVVCGLPCNWYVAAYSGTGQLEAARGKTRKVDDIHAAVTDLKEKEIRSLSEEATIGAHGKPVVFLHPRDCGGVLIELEQA